MNRLTIGFQGDDLVIQVVRDSEIEQVILTRSQFREVMKKVDLYQQAGFL